MTFAALFPGQGSQTVGMLSDFEAGVPKLKKRFPRPLMHSAMIFGRLPKMGQLNNYP